MTTNRLKTIHRTHRLTNYMEELTGDLLQTLLPEYKHKKFSTGALEDIKALALNRLWPMYTTTSEGKDYLKRVVEQDKVEKDVVRELRAAIDIVLSNPRA
ncbi:MAG: hypothetical protein MOGMAGMI_00723 [Candidatus Omnitrophica bacterium]|nr:hypothetical protein [Candidatus Omnitrophota bacterium]